MLDCLRNIVGLSDVECPCLDEGKPTAANLSDSGYYLTDKTDGIPIKFASSSIGDCSGGGVWAMLEDAREQGIKQFLQDLSIQVETQSKLKYETFKGLTQPLDYTDTNIYQTVKKFAGLKVSIKESLSSKMIIKSIQLNVNCDALITAKIIDSKLNILASVDVNCIGGKWSTGELETALTVSKGTVYVVYELPENCKVNSNKIHCGCTKSLQLRKSPFLNFASVEGISSDTFETISKGSIYNNNALGCRVEVVMGCDLSKWLCDLDFSHFLGNSIDWIIAKTLQVKMSSILALSIANSPKINTYTLKSKESMFGKFQTYNKMYKVNLAYIAKNLPSTVSMCYECDRRIFKKPILV